MNISVREISKRLAEQAEAVCKLLLPGGRQVKQEWLAGDVAGNPGDSLKVQLSGQHVGQWRDWANEQDKGDLVDLWRISRGLTPGEAVKQAKEFLGIAETEFRPSRTYERPADNAKTGIAPLDASGKAMHFLVTTRGLTPPIVNKFGVSGCTEKRAIVFPCYDPSGALANRSYRTLPTNGEKKRVWQDAGCAPCLFGWHALPSSAYETRTVLLCEGQIDAMTWAQWGIAALSIPNGSGQTWIEYEVDNLAVFDHIYISFDMDGAGREIAERAIARLGRHRCLIVKLPHKDANDCLLAGCTDEDARRWLSEVELPHVEGLVLVSEMLPRLLAEIAPKPEPFTLPFFKKQWPDSGLYFRPAELTVWTGVSSNGKSTFLRYLTLGAIYQANMVAFIATMEVRIERELSKMLTASSDLPADEKVARAFIRRMTDKILFADTVGYISQKSLLEMMWFAFQRHGAAHFVIDSLMKIEGLEEDYPAQGEFLNKLQEFAKTSGSHVHLVCHPRKTAAGAQLGKQDIKGSSLILNNTDNLVSITRNVEKNDLIREGAKIDEWGHMHDTEIAVEKQRDSGWEGSFYLKFNPKRFTFSECDPPRRQEKKPRGARS